MSSIFTCTVPAGTKSALGVKLDEDVEWSFQTALLAFNTNVVEWAGPTAQVALTFNQPVDADAIFANISVLAGGSYLCDCTILAKDDVTLRPKIQAAVKEDRDACVVFSIDDDLNALAKSGKLKSSSKKKAIEEVGAEVEVNLMPGAGGLAGPEVTEDALTFRFNTLTDLRVLPPNERKSIFGNPNAQKKQKLLVGTYLTFECNNELETIPAAADPAIYFKIKPTLKDVKISSSYRSVSVGPVHVPGNYSVTLIKGGVTDLYGQRLQEDVSRDFQVHPITTPSISVMPSSMYFGSNGASSAIVTLDPFIPPVVYVSTKNVAAVKVKAYSVNPLHHCEKFWDSFSRNGKSATPQLGTRVWDASVKVEAPKNEAGDIQWNDSAETMIDLSKAFGCDDTLKCGRSKETQLVVNFVSEPAFDDDEPRDPPSDTYWFSWSDIGITYTEDREHVYAWTYSMVTGAVLRTPNLYLISRKNKTLPLEREKEENGEYAAVASVNMNYDPQGEDEQSTTQPQYNLLVAELGNRASIISILRGTPREQDEKYIWHIIDDRKQYRPHDTVNIKGILRQVNARNALIELPRASSSHTLKYKVADSRSKEIIKETKVDITSSFCFDFSFEIPAQLNLGNATISWKWGEESHQHTISIQEYKRKGAKISIDGPPRSQRVREPIDLTCFAHAFTGEVLGSTSAVWNVDVCPASFNPFYGALYGYTIGWKDGGGQRADRYTWSAEKNYSGKHHLRVTLDQIAVPISVTVNCSLKDPTNEELTASHSVMVHSTNVYVGAKVEKSFVGLGEAFKFFVATVDPNRKFDANCALKMIARGFPFESCDGETKPADVLVQECALTPSDAGPIEFSFIPKFRGIHNVTFECTDLEGNVNATTVRDLFVYGPQTEGEKNFQLSRSKVKPRSNVRPAPHAAFAEQSVRLAWDRENEVYEAGNTAELQIISPFWPAEGTLFIHKNDVILKTETFSVRDTMVKVPIKVEEDYLPRVFVDVKLVGVRSRPSTPEPQQDLEDGDEEGEAGKESAGAPSSPKKQKTEDDAQLFAPAYASGSTRLNVSKTRKSLKVNIGSVITKEGVQQPHAAFLPGDDVTVRVDVAAFDGTPVPNAEVVVVVVDEAVLEVTGYTLGDPLDAFYPNRTGNFQTRSTHNHLFLTNKRPKIVAAAKKPEEEKGDVGFITITYISGRLLRFAGNSDTPVRKLKAFVEERDGLPPNAQRLLYNGKQLTDEGTLKEQGVPDGATLNMVLRLFGGGNTDEKEELPQNVPKIYLRTNMNALAHFAPLLTTDETGTVLTNFKLPDSLTRYRVMAVANTVDRFGKAENSLVARLPLMVRQAPPRFLNFGDRCVVPIVVQNETDEAKEVWVGMRGRNVDIAGHGWKTTIPARGRTSIPFNIAPSAAGTATFQVAASDTSLHFADAAQFAFPVHAPTTTETVACTGQLDGDKVFQQPIAKFRGDDVVATAGGMEVSLTSTVFTELSCAASYTARYPYECTEQISSRIIALCVFKDFLPLLKDAKDDSNDEEKAIPTAESIEELVKELIGTIIKRRESDGKFGYWNKGGNSYDYVNVFAYLALAIAKQKDFDVPESIESSTLKYLTGVVMAFTKTKDKKETTSRSLSSRALRFIRRQATSAEEDDAEAVFSLACFAVYVMNLWEMSDPKIASLMLANKGFDKMAIEQIAWLLPCALEDKPQLKAKYPKIYSHIQSRITQSGGAAHFVASSWTESNRVFLRSTVRHNAAILESLVTCDPTNPLIPKLVRGLLDMRKNGRWINTQDNAFALIAMNKYFTTMEKIEPSFLVDLWVGNAHAAKHEFIGRSSDVEVVNVPMSYLVKEENNHVTLKKSGQGRMYYRIAVEYAPKALFLPPRDSGFEVTRTYHPVDNKDDVVLGVDKNGHKQYTIKAGAKVLIKLVLVATSVRNYVALVDQLPGGLEPQNAGIAAKSGTQTGLSYWSRFWSHQNVRDSRVEVFINYLYPGLYTYSYTVRAITRGEYVTPATKAEEMYNPDVFGRSEMLTVLVQ